jgi:hypothetical protein
MIQKTALKNVEFQSTESMCKVNNHVNITVVVASPIYIESAVSQF